MNFITWNAVMTAAKASGVRLESRTRISSAIIKASVENKSLVRQGMGRMVKGGAS